MIVMPRHRMGGPLPMEDRPIVVEACWPAVAPLSPFSVATGGRLAPAAESWRSSVLPADCRFAAVAVTQGPRSTSRSQARSRRRQTFGSSPARGHVALAARFRGVLASLRSLRHPFSNVGLRGEFSSAATEVSSRTSATNPIEAWKKPSNSLSAAPGSPGLGQIFHARAADSSNAGSADLLYGNQAPCD
jgi:hypothetical protein